MGRLRDQWGGKKVNGTGIFCNGAPKKPKGRHKNPRGQQGKGFFTFLLMRLNFHELNEVKIVSRINPDSAAYRDI
jgi:hypothetical protein